MSFGSRCFNPTELRYCTFRRELLAAEMAIQRYRHLLEGRFFILKTDNSALSRLLGAGPYSDVLCRYIEFLAISVRGSMGKKYRKPTSRLLSRTRCDGTCQQCRMRSPRVRRMTFVRRPGRHVTERYTCPGTNRCEAQPTVHRGGRPGTGVDGSCDRVTLLHRPADSEQTRTGYTWKPRAVYWHAANSRKRSTVISGGR